MTTAVSSSVLDKINGTTAKQTNATDEAGSAERFMKLLVTQMQNQDPLNPMDNAQVTSQIAQINTVSGIAKLNTTVEGLSGQFVQMQALQGVSLIGKDVVVPGDKLAIADGVGRGGFELGAAADSVKIEVLSASKQVVDTIDLGAQGAGMHSFQWPVGSKTDGVSFRVAASSGGTALTPTALMQDTVVSVSSSGGELKLDLARSGDTAYSKVKSLN